MFWGYYDFMSDYHKTPEQAMEEAKAEQMAKADWSEEVKELKRKLAHGKKVKHRNPLKN